MWSLLVAPYCGESEMRVLESDVSGSKPCSMLSHWASDLASLILGFSTFLDGMIIKRGLSAVGLMS